MDIGLIIKYSAIVVLLIVSWIYVIEEDYIKAMYFVLLAILNALI